MKKLLTLLAFVFCLNGWAQCTLSLTIPTITPAGCSSANGTIIGALGTGGSGNYTYAWNGGSITSNSSYTNNAGSYPLQVNDVTTGCTFTQYFNIPNAGSPTVTVNSSTICAGQTATLTPNVSGGSAPYTYTWSPTTGLTNIGGGAVVANPNSTTTYYLIVSGNGCTSSAATSTVTVNPLPTVSITPISAGCVPLCTSFTVNGSSTIASYYWDLGNGQTSTSVSPYVCYNVAANSIVTLSVTSTLGCVNTTTTSIVANTTPAITITNPSPYCPGDNIPSPVINTSPSTGVTYSWSVSNVNIGMSSAGSGIPASYTAPANSSLVDQVGIITYTASLGSCSSTVNETITIKPTPVIQPIANAFYCPGQLTTSINFSCLPTGGTPVFTWSTFSSPGISQIGNIPSFTTTNTTSVSSVSTFTVSASLNNCLSAFSSFAITIYPNPIANFSSNTVCEGMPTSFTDLSTPNTGSITVNTWSWDMNNDGVFNDATTQNPQYIIQPAGVDSVRLFVSTNSLPSCTASVSKIVTINPGPVVDFVSNTTNGCPFLPVNFANLSTINNGTIASWNWNFGNGNLSSSMNPPSQIYSNQSNSNNAFYTVSLKAASNSGCVTTKTKNNYIEVFAKPSVSYTLTQNAAPFTWDAYPTYSDSVATAIWNWGDGTNTMGLYPSHTYSATGRYNICVIVTNAGGCSDSTCQNDTIYRLAQNNSTNNNMLYVNVLQGTTRINQLAINNLVSVYPNPSSGIYTIQTTIFDNTSAEVYNLLGEKLFTGKLQSIATQINLSSLASGIYQLKLIKNNIAIYQTKISKIYQ